MGRDLANVERELEQMKASRQQLASDNAKAIEQIRANQEQAARDIASHAELLKASQDQVAQLLAVQQNTRPKTSAPQPQAAIGTRKPLPTPATLQASARPQAPRQLRPEER